MTMWQIRKLQTYPKDCGRCRFDQGRYRHCGRSAEVSYDAILTLPWIRRLTIAQVPHELSWVALD